MLVRRVESEDFAKFQSRVHREQELTEDLYKLRNLVDALVIINRECWTESDWYYEANRLRGAIGREMYLKCRAIAALYGYVAPLMEEEEPRDLPF